MQTQVSSCNATLLVNSNNTNLSVPLWTRFTPASLVTNISHAPKNDDQTLIRDKKPDINNVVVNKENKATSKPKCKGNTSFAACERCYAAKIKCNEERPCKGCIKAKVKCINRIPKKRGRKRRAFPDCDGKPQSPPNNIEQQPSRNGSITLSSCGSSVCEDMQLSSKRRRFIGSRTAMFMTERDIEQIEKRLEGEICGPLGELELSATCGLACLANLALKIDD